ncbi:MAG: MFS transporter [Fluviicola sp.]
MIFQKYPKNFWIISVALFFFIVSFNMVIPELNDYISGLHESGEDLKGLIIFLFSLSAAISRPFSGKLSDNIGRKKVMLIGASVGVIICLSYPISGLISDSGATLFGISVFLSFRFLHGLSAGFLPTGATALVTDILHPSQRSVGMGIWGTFISAGFGAGQILADPLTDAFGINSLFFVSGFFALIAFGCLLYIEETLPNPLRYQPAFVKVRWNDIFEPPVMPAATVMFLTTISTGIVFVIAQEISKSLGVNKGLFFGFYVFSTIGVRLFASKLSDVIGRRKALLIGVTFMCLSMILVSLSAASLGLFIISAIVFGLSTGVNSPTIMAWTADLSADNRRGIGAGTLFIALEIGIMVGSISTVFTYDNTMASIPRTVLFGAFFCIVAIAYLFWHLRYRDSVT